jgi:hypothetical protein
VRDPWVSRQFSGVINIYDTTTNTLASSFAVAGEAYSVVFVTPPPPGPTSKNQCKNGGWQTFTNPAFANQGDCVKYVNRLP